MPRPGQLGSGSYALGEQEGLTFFGGTRAATLDGQGVDVSPADHRSSERAYRDLTEESVSGNGYRAVAGDSISRILGTSNSQAVGNFIRANGLTSSGLEVGRNYFVPDSAYAYGDSAALGQAVLNGDNTRLEALAAQRATQQQNEWDSLRTGSWSGRTGTGGPVWHVGDVPQIAGSAVDMIPTGGYSNVPTPPSIRSDGWVGKGQELLDDLNNGPFGKALQAWPQENFAVGGVKAALVFAGTMGRNVLGDAAAVDGVLANVAREASALETVGNVGGAGDGALVVVGEAAGALPNGASLPLGSKRLQFNQPESPRYQPIRNDPTTIGEASYSGHAIDRMQERGLMPSVIQNTIDTGLATPSRMGTTVYYDSVNNVSVVTNAQGKVVTVKYGK